MPISITINGGELKAYTPIYQANPQGNSDEDIKKVSVEVNNAENGVGPKIYSNSNNIVWSANKVVTLNGGVYNLNPAAYVASNKAVVENTAADTKDMYPYMLSAQRLLPPRLPRQATGTMLLHGALTQFLLWLLLL